MRNYLRAASVVLLTACFMFTSVTAVKAEIHRHAKEHRISTKYASSSHGKKSSKSSKKTYKTSKKSSPKPATSSASSEIKTAQIHLQNLGYYKDKIDGSYGSKTKAAVKKFQLHNGLKEDGKLNAETMYALKTADMTMGSPPQQLGVLGGSVNVPPTLTPNLEEPAVDFYTATPDYYGHYDQQYADAMLLGPPSIPSRFARIMVQENAGEEGSSGKSYDVTVNGQPLFGADNQPSVVGISRTFSLAQEDVVIFTTYRPSDRNCLYRHYLLSVDSQNTKLHEVMNCTRGYQARMTNGSVFMVFPEDDSGRIVGSTWRYEGGVLHHL